MTLKTSKLPTRESSRRHPKDDEYRTHHSTNRSSPARESSRRHPKDDEYRTHHSTNRSSETDVPKSRHTDRSIFPEFFADHKDFFSAHFDENFFPALDEDFFPTHHREDFEEKHQPFNKKHASHRYTSQEEDAPKFSDGKFENIPPKQDHCRSSPIPKDSFKDKEGADPLHGVDWKAVAIIYMGITATFRHIKLHKAYAVMERFLKIYHPKISQNLNQKRIEKIFQVMEKGRFAKGYSGLKHDRLREFEIETGLAEFDPDS